MLSVGTEGSERPPFVDSVALYAFRSRQRLAMLLAQHFGRDPGAILGHLALLLDRIERVEAARPSPTELTPARVEAAEALLLAPDLLDQAARAFEALGYVGEQATKRLVYLIATSRLLARPLSGILLAPSGAGKSDLLDKLAALLPSEAVEDLSRLTAAALYYAGPDALRHRLVIVDEQAGVVDADYSVRTLQTKGVLRQAVTVGGRAERYETHGPIALLSGTTRAALHPEHLSRCLELSLDDSPEQTRRIQAAQRRSWSGCAQPRPNLERWRDAQRLLKTVEVVIPFAEALDYPARTTRDRRDQQKLLGLVAAHALLHQRQREADSRGRLLATPADYAAVHALLANALVQSHDGLSPRATRVYRLLARDTRALTRREIAERIGWNYMTSARALDELVAQELAVVVEPRAPRRYQLLAPFGALGAGALTEPAGLRVHRRSQAFTGRGGS